MSREPTVEEIRDAKQMLPMGTMAGTRLRIAYLVAQRNDLAALLHRAGEQLDRAGAQLAFRGDVCHAAPCAGLRDKISVTLRDLDTR